MKSNILTCNICPVGCKLEVVQANANYTIKGNKCSRGLEYAAGFKSDNSRRITGRCLLVKGSMGRLPVVSSGLIPTELIDQVLDIIKDTTVAAPVAKGQIIIENVLDTGINIIAQRKVGRSSK
jgi:CxxC motif-containing protein